MSLLGFDTIGRSAIGEIPRNVGTNTIFAATPSALLLSGIALGFQTALSSATGSLGCAGLPAAVRLTLSGGQSGWLTSGQSVRYVFAASIGSGALIASGNSAVATATMPASGRNHVVLGQAPVFVGSLAVQSVAYQSAGYSVDYQRGFEAWFPLGLVESQWSGSDDPGQSWSPAPDVPDHWLTSSRSSVPWESISSPAPRWSTD
ncbi:hypothetical protein SSBR45G_23980 [Bradyrhizobium sp. SSBR45G]|uniref:hypothetical protein n=1 Tax=unclassified Bradyrhizobium TaxID=2631580 RepID=UPI0023429C5E|nr:MULTISPECIES: hypothetical protein [unclassified Bradyrhizobium]GLH77490.1 hypothetical protein SSBR45G_23980 [Bradyrhizobium sp. SSBR45G]GLH84404.1 hypothetical protein SSBR45R_18640 [Bradyrhizobium sp. SSBR45R]